jgi:anti-sigma B factor antagonist
MLWEIEHREQIAICRLTGELDAGAATDLVAVLDREIDAGVHRLVVDLARVGYIDSSGLGALVKVLKKARSAGGDVRLVGPGPDVRKVLELTRLDRIFEISRTTDDAVRQYLAGTR